MKKLIIIVIPFLFLLSGCTKETKSPGEVPEESYKSGQTVPLKVWLQAEEDQSVTTLCTPEGYGVGLHDSWISGHATHFGIITPDENYLYFDDCAITSPTTVVGNFSGVMKGANGDQMEYSGEVNMDLTDFSIWGHTDFFNGTGRFEGASGYVDFTGSTNMETHVSTWMGVGSITFP